ncbi:MAG: hypothetical protein ACYDAE_08260 [Steroidobacteraceae bacterium]
MNLTPSTAVRAALLPRLPLGRLVACLLFCCLTDSATLFAKGKLGPGTWHRVK